MGSKLKPGKFDCYENAEPDEPMFVLLARDRLAPSLTAIWSAIRAGNRREARKIFNELIVGPQSSVYVVSPDSDTALEASDCALEMDLWRRANRPFCHRHRAAGGKVYAVLNHTLCHLGIYPFTGRYTHKLEE